MASTGIPLSRQASPWPLVVLIVVLAALGLWFISHNIVPYLQYDPKIYGDLWPRRFGLMLHVAGGLTALSVGLMQLWLGLSGRTSGKHRVLGRVYASGVLVGSVGAYYLSLTLAAKYFVYGAGLFMLATAWLLTTGMAILSIRRRAFEQHREWMIRSYVVTFAFVTFRLLDQWLAAWHVASPDDVDTLMAWACWSVPLLLVEPLIQLRRLKLR